MELNESDLIGRLQQRDEKAFEQVFKTHFKSLHGYAISILQDESAAEEMVQHVFYKLWDRSEHINISGPIAAYLYRAVNNSCLNHLKYKKIRYGHQMTVIHRGETSVSASESIQLKELQEKLREAMQGLPEQCRTVFQLSRFESLRYREIAERLGISVKTVENHMGKALKTLREKLADFLVLILLFINSKF